MNKGFKVHMLNEQGKALAEGIASAFDQCLEHLVKMCPPGRELAIVKTKLEEACFFAKKAMASVADNQEGAAQSSAPLSESEDT